MISADGRKRLAPAGPGRRLLSSASWSGATIAFLVMVFVLGGGSRSDIASLVILRPVAMAAMLIAAYNYRENIGREGRPLIFFILACASMVALHLVPLPWALWTVLPGRQDLAAIATITGFAGNWYPVTLYPAGAVNALLAISVPAAMLFLALRAGAKAASRQVVVILLLGVFSGLIGLAQLLTDSSSPLYLYRITNEASAVGLFANRNHHAYFLASLFPLLAYFAGERVQFQHDRDRRRMLMFAFALTLLPVIISTGSRGGAVVAILAIVLTPLVGLRSQSVGRARRGATFESNPWIVRAGVALVVLLVVFAVARSEVASRLTEGSLANDVRYQVWPVTARLIADYLPLGSGAGSFVPVYQSAEPATQIYADYINHAHNDVLEILLTFGVPGAALLAMALVWLLRSLTDVLRVPAVTDELRLARAGGIILVVLALGSIADYPLRTPSIACLAALASLWLWHGAQAARFQQTDDLDQKLSLIR